MLTPLVLVFHGGSKFIAPKDIFGNTCTDFDAAEAIWGFFEHLGRK
jgi:poly(3-hydroxybutyrate) depolymerase